MNVKKETLPAFQAYQLQFARHVRDPDTHGLPSGVPANRMRVYADIVFTNIEGTLAACYPVCKKVLGAEHWRTLVRTFFASHRCTTPLFRQIPEEFLRYLENTDGDNALLPPYLYSLAHYEWIELALSVSEVEAPQAIDPLGDLMTGIPALTPVLALLSYPYAVHMISPRLKPLQPSPTPIHLLVFRDGEGDVRFVELNAVSVRLLNTLQAGALTGMQAINLIASELPHLDQKVVLQHGHELLAELHRQGAVVGVQRST